jgi:hypothetical protein
MLPLQPAEPAPSRWGRFPSYALVVVLAVELAVWEAFLVPARVLGVPLPLSAVAAFVGNVVLCRAGARVLGSSSGAVAPAACWLVIALGLSVNGPLGDLVVPGTVRGVLFLVAGAVGAALGVGINRSARATPGAPTGR